MARREKSAATRPSGRQLLELAREHQDALAGKGLSATVLDRYETALQGLDGKGPTPAAGTLAKELRREVGEVQAAVRREFPNNAAFQSVFQAGEPLPDEPRRLLALGRLVAREAPEYSQNLIKHGVDAATVKHVQGLCLQLERELGGVDPAQDAQSLEGLIRDAARRAFEGKPELAAFEGR